MQYSPIPLIYPYFPHFEIFFLSHYVVFLSQTYTYLSAILAGEIELPIVFIPVPAHCDHKTNAMKI